MPLPLTERRFLHAELRADSQGDELSLIGYASVYNSESEDLGGFREKVMPGAFSRSIREGADVKCLMNHDPSLVLGRVKNGTLKLEEDAHGLRFRCMLPPTQTGRDLYALVKRGDIDSCSFAFIPKDQSWEDVRSENGDLYASRKLMDVDLLDVSAVTNPAYPSTSLSARSFFPEGEPVEMRSAIDALVAKRVPVVEERGAEAQPPEPYAISLPQPFDSDMKQEWWNAFLVGYLDALHVLKMKGQEAISVGIAAANLACQPETETDPEIVGQSKNPSDVPHEVVATDAERAAEALEVENRKKKESDAQDVSNPDSDNYNPDDPNYDSSLDYSDDNYEGDDAKERKAKATAKGGADGGEDDSKEIASGQERTKTVGDKVLRASDYAWIGDPNNTKTWKLPVDTLERTASALLRFHQTKGIPDDKKDGVWRVVVSACKQFGVAVSEEDSLRASISHDVATAILNEVTYDQDAANLEAYCRMIAIQTDLQ